MMQTRAISLRPASAQVRNLVSSFSHGLAFSGRTLGLSRDGYAATQRALLLPSLGASQPGNTDQR